MEKHNLLSRRSLLKRGGSCAAALSSITFLTDRKARAGANDRVQVAVMGIRGMGQDHISNYNALTNARVVALCDVDENLFAGTIEKHFNQKGHPRPKTYVDVRKMLEDKDIDAVSIVTPNHWHSLAAIWSIQAGKHVSVEKPCCHNVYEGWKLVEASRKYDVIVQDGCEERSNPCARSMAEFLHGGGLGQVYMAKGLCYKWRETIGTKSDEPVPAGVHYDLWLGPAPKRPFNPNRFHYNWHWNWDYGNGDIGNQGVHEMDIARWGLGVTLPTRVAAIGGHFMFHDDQNTPNTVTAVFEFLDESAPSGGQKKLLQFEVMHWIHNRPDPMWSQPEKDPAGGYMISDTNTVGNLFYGSKGYMVKEVKKWRTYMGKERESGPAGGGLGNHYADFIDAIKQGNPRQYNRSIEEGFYTCALIHLANISYRLGRSLDFDPVTMKIKGDSEANAMLTREYRAPFIVPDKV
jgi:predicted dehydrogenase